MQVITKEDLLLVLKHADNRSEFSLYDFDRLLVTYGDTYFMSDGAFHKFKQSERMIEVRKEFTK